MRILSIFAAFLASTLIASAQTCLFHTGDSTGYPYRIPAIAKAKNGQLIALSDLRPCGGDIGYGRVDILSRVSADNGASWSEAVPVLQGSGKGADAGYGDACLVADRDRNELLLVCVSGDVPYWQSSPEHRQRIVATHARYNKKNGKWEWSPLPPFDLTKQVYEDIFDGRIRGLFMGSGRICQSRMVKVGKYYRLYGALCTHRGNFVIYSDDFGRTWNALGSAEVSCAPSGDEPKCEELPDGSVLLSSRRSGGRFFNVFRYTDTAKAKGIGCLQRRNPHRSLPPCRRQSHHIGPPKSAGRPRTQQCDHLLEGTRCRRRLQYTVALRLQLAGSLPCYVLRLCLFNDGAAGRRTYRVFL